MDNLQTFIFIGRSGCGKGVQTKALIAHLTEVGVITAANPVYYQETGTRFREFVASDNYSGRLEKTIMDRSERAPDFLAVWIWSSLFVEKMTGREHLIMDGSPRSLLEAKMLETALDFYDRQKVTVIYLDVSRAESKKRLEARGRADDQKAGDIDKRLDWFDRDVLPAVEYYERNPRYRFVRVNGEQPMEAVSVAMLAGIS